MLQVFVFQVVAMALFNHGTRWLLLACIAWTACNGNITSDPTDVTVTMGMNATFQCGFSGNSPPLWDVFRDTQMIHSLSDGQTSPPYYYPHVQESPASLMVHASEGGLNGSCFRCRISMIGSGDISSNEACIVVYGPPLPPPGLLMVNSTYSSVTIVWGQPWSRLLISDYNLAVRTAAGDSLVTEEVREASLTRRVTLGGLSEQVDYVVSVRAVAGALVGEPASLQLTTPQAERPSPPANIRSMVSIFATSQITIQWDAPEQSVLQSPITGYTVYYRLQSVVDFATQVNSDLSSLSFNLPGVSIGRIYVVKALAVNSAGDSQFSSTITVSSTYLQSVEVVPVVGGLNVTCLFAMTGVELQCQFKLALPSGNVATRLANADNSQTVPIAHFFLNSLQPLSYTYETAAVLRSDGSVVESFNVSGVATPLDNGVLVQPLTNTQIGIIAGVVGGTAVIVLCLVLAIIVSLACRYCSRDDEKTVKHEFRPEAVATPEYDYVTNEHGNGTNPDFMRSVLEGRSDTMSSFSSRFEPASNKPPLPAKGPYDV